MSRRRRSPSDPAAAARKRAEEARADAAARERDPARWGEMAAPKSMREALTRHGVDYALDGKGRLKAGAHKVDLWEELHARRALSEAQLVAVRRLQRDLADRYGLGRKGEQVKVEGAGNRAAVTDAMIDAGRWVDRVLQLVGPPSSRLLAALLEPGVRGEPDPNWRETVARITGETNDRAQAAAVRLAAQSLSDVYEALARAKRSDVTDAQRALDHAL